MGNIVRKISRAGLVLLLIGGVLLGASLGDAITSFKEAKSFDDVLENGAAAGDHVAGQVPFLLDSFATMQTYSENTKTGAVTPKKTTFQYYVLPAGEGYMGLQVGSQSISSANKLVDQTYDYLMGGDVPTAELTTDASVKVMDKELEEMFRETMEEYGYTEQEIEDMGPILMVMPRAYTTIRVFCAVGGVLFLIGAVMLVLRWRKVSAQIRKAQEEAPGPELD